MTKRDEAFRASNPGKAIGGSAGPLFDPPPIVEAKAIPDGVAFIANGPIQFATVNGEPVGDIKRGDVVKIEAVAGAGPTIPDVILLSAADFERLNARAAARAADRESPENAGWRRGIAESAKAADGWTTEEKLRLERAIRSAAAAAGPAGFTADDVWPIVPDVRVRKGLAAMLNAAARRGEIENTGAVVVSRRGGEHDHGQRLTVWRIAK